MRSSDALFQLIKSLTKGERRNFKLFARLQDGDKQYIRLFEAIDEQEEYNEKELLERFKGEKFTRQFSVAKNYLHNFILRTLHIFHKDNQTELQVLMHQVQILKGKNLFDQAHKTLRKARLMAERFERFQELLQLLQIERELLFRMGKQHDFDVLMKDIENAEKKAMLDAQNLMEYRHLTNECFVSLKKSHTARKNADLEFFGPILSNPLITNFELARTSRAKIQRSWILIDCYQFAGDYAKCEELTKELIGHYESNPSVLEDSKFKYLVSISYLSVFQHYNNKEKESLDTLRKIRDYPVQSDEERIMVFEKYYSFIIGYSIEKCRPELGLEAINEIESQIKFVETKLRKSVTLSIYFLSANYFLVNGSPSSALKWINLLLNEPKSELRVDIQCMARILNLMIHFELGNKDIIEYFVKSTTRFLMKKDHLLKFERVILHFFNQAAQCPSLNEAKTLLPALKEEILEVIQDPFEAKAMRLLDIVSWIDSLIDGVSMIELSLSRGLLAEK